MSRKITLVSIKQIYKLSIFRIIESLKKIVSNRIGLRVDKERLNSVMFVVFALIQILLWSCNAGIFITGNASLNALRENRSAFYADQLRSTESVFTARYVSMPITKQLCWIIYLNCLMTNQFAKNALIPETIISDRLYPSAIRKDKRLLSIFHGDILMIQVDLSCV